MAINSYLSGKGRDLSQFVLRYETQFSAPLSISKEGHFRCARFVPSPSDRPLLHPLRKKAKNALCNRLITKALQKGNFYAVKDLLLPSKRPTIRR